MSMKIKKLLKKYDYPLNKKEVGELQNRLPFNVQMYYKSVVKDVA